ncbi:MAG TPA: ABC transporter permease [Verrucomicrobiales bacterium]|nr:ABC transporter permease [Verrucomicrobiales bacterium]
MNPVFKHHLDILIGRNLAILMGSPFTLFLLFAQPPLIGYFIGWGWKGEDLKDPAVFIMTLAFVWMGCMNTFALIVKERPVYERERMFALDIRAYILSKLTVMSVFGAIQVILLLMVQGKLMRLPSGIHFLLALFFLLWLTSVTSAALGLFISACSKSAQSAGITVPIVLIPQIIFSEFVLRENIDKKIPAKIENCTIIKWSFDALKTIRDELEFGILFQSSFVLLLMTGLLLGLTFLKLKFDEW